MTKFQKYVHDHTTNMTNMDSLT